MHNNKHINIFLVLHFYEHLFHFDLMQRDSLQRTLLQQALGTKIIPNHLLDAAFARHNRPKAQHLIQGYRALGLNAQAISDILDISIHNVYYYFRKKSLKNTVYINPVLQDYEYSLSRPNIDDN